MQEDRHTKTRCGKKRLLQNCSGAIRCSPEIMQNPAPEIPGSIDNEELSRITTHLARNKWGQVFRSDMRWADWETLGLETLFRLELSARVINMGGTMMLVIPLEPGSTPRRGCILTQEMRETNFYIVN